MSRTGHNAASRKQIIQEVCKDIAALEADRKQIAEEIRTIKQKRIKGDLDMKVADFNAAYRLYQLDSDDQATFLDTLRETFQALGKGAQLDFLSVQQQAEHVRQKEEVAQPKRGPGRPRGSKAKAKAKTNGHANGSAGNGKLLLIDPNTRQPTDEGRHAMARAVRAQVEGATKAGNALGYDEALDQVLCASIWRDVDVDQFDRQSVLDLIEEATPLVPAAGADESDATAQPVSTEQEEDLRPAFLQRQEAEKAAAVAFPDESDDGLTL